MSFALPWQARRARIFHHVLDRNPSSLPSFQRGRLRIDFWI
jgi:hypothetical protein